MAEDDAVKLDTKSAEEKGAQKRPIAQEEEAKTESAKL